MHRVHTESLDREEKRRIWDELIQQYLSSGQTVKAFSESQGLKSDLLSYYVRSYRLKQQQNDNFIPLGISSTPQTGELRFELGMLKCYVPITTSDALLQTLIQSLKSSC